MTEVAILVAAYNAATTLHRCLDSLCGQTLTAIEILCIDDCSTDNTYSILSQRAAADSRIKVLQTPKNSGQAVARNIALMHVHSPYVCMVDADDWLSPNALEHALHCFHQFPQTDCVMFQLVIHDDADHHEENYGMPEILSQGKALSGERAFELCLDGWMLHGLYVTRYRLYQTIPFDTSTRLYSDDNTSCLHYLHSREVRACKGIYYYRRHEHSLTTSFNLLRFDQMEAMLSLLLQLKKETLRPGILQRYEGHRWDTFIRIYRLYLTHEQELDKATREQLQSRFHTILHTFRPSRLPLRRRWKPGYWLTLNSTLFHFQQKVYFNIWMHGIKTFFPFK